uniref:Uncharacterized protein n=1 Tax=Ananas comosus var. bracteatus TaxID=296719 RepID=A0A6V7PYU4_ANACO|nr:unnamed protein product [Ananas comosus var. bracteatus]
MTETRLTFMNLSVQWSGSLLLLPLPSGKTLSFVGKGMLLPLYCAGAKTRISEFLLHWAFITPFFLLVDSKQPQKSVPNTAEGHQEEGFFIRESPKKKEDFLICLFHFSLIKITQNYLIHKNEMLVMLNIFSLIGICLNSVLYSSSFFFAKLPEAYAIFNPIVDVMPVIPVLFFLLAFVWQAADQRCLRNASSTDKEPSNVESSKSVDGECSGKVSIDALALEGVADRTKEDLNAVLQGSEGAEINLEKFRQEQVYNHHAWEGSYGSLKEMSGIVGGDSICILGSLTSSLCLQLGDGALLSLFDRAIPEIFPRSSKGFKRKPESYEKRKASFIAVPSLPVEILCPNE